MPDRRRTPYRRCCKTPQTSGGLLMAVDPADADALLAELKGTVPSAQRVGVMRRYEGGARIVLH